MADLEPIAARCDGVRAAVVVGSLSVVRERELRLLSWPEFFFFVLLLLSESMPLENCVMNGLERACGMVHFFGFFKIARQGGKRSSLWEQVGDLVTRNTGANEREKGSAAE